jgi:hypothetical protein
MVQVVAVPTVVVVVLDEIIHQQLVALELVVKALQEEAKPQLTVQQEAVALVRWGLIVLAEKT